MKIVTFSFIVPNLLEDKFEHLNNGYQVWCDTDKATQMLQELADHADHHDKIRQEIKTSSRNRIKGKDLY